MLSLSLSLRQLLHQDVPQAMIVQALTRQDTVVKALAEELTYLKTDLDLI